MRESRPDWERSNRVFGENVRVGEAVSTTSGQDRDNYGVGMLVRNHRPASGGTETAEKYRWE